MVKRLLCSMIVCVVVLAELWALTNHEIEMFRNLQARWTKQYDDLVAERDGVPSGDPRYLELTKRMVKADYWKGYYQEAQVDRSSWWHVVANTVIWSAADLAETASIMWESSSDVLKNAFTGNWTELVKQAADSLMRQKLRAMMRESFSGQVVAQIEEHFYTAMLAPKLESPQLGQFADAAFEQVQDGLKDAYVEEVKRQELRCRRLNWPRTGRRLHSGWVELSMPRSFPWT